MGSVNIGLSERRPCYKIDGDSDPFSEQLTLAVAAGENKYI